MKKKLFALALLVIVVVVGVFIFVNSNGTAQNESWGDPSTDPQTLMSPRWFLSELVYNGQQVDLGEVQITLQFTQDGQINGSAGCNEYFASYETGDDGQISFSPLGATKMYCDNRMEQENAFLTSMDSVSQFKTEQGKLVLSSADEQMTLTFNMPPK
jgi:heat shock protein HslJ